MQKMLLILILLFNFLYAKLNENQIKKIIVAYKIGKKIKAKDGMTFGYTLPAILGVETSYGKFYVGDKYDKNGKLKSLYLASLGNFQIKLTTARMIIKKTPELYKKYYYLINPLGNKVYKLYEQTLYQYKKIKKIKTLNDYKKYVIITFLSQNKYYKKYLYFKRIYYSKVWNKRAKKGNKKAIKTLEWAKRNMDYSHKMYIYQLNNYIKNIIFYEEYKKINIKKQKLRKKLKLYKKYIKKDTLLINKLIGDFEFSALVAGYYLKYVYEMALDKKFSNPYRMAVGRYNGGWGNKKYYKKVIKQLKFVKKIIQKNLK